MAILFINFLLYFVWTIQTYSKNKSVNLYLFVVVFYTVVAFLGFYTVREGIYYETFNQSLNRLTFTPYLLAFITYYILFFPLKYVEIKKEQTDFLFSHTFRKIIKVWILYYTLYFFLKLYEAITSISSGLGAAYESRHIEGTQLFKYDHPILAMFNAHGTTWLGITSPIIMCVAFMGIYRKKISNKFAFLLIFLCITPLFLSSIGQGSRGGLFMTMFKLMFFIILFGNFLSKKTKKKIVYFTAYLSIGIIVFSWIITSDRFGANNEGNVILRYFGESFPNLGVYFWGQVQTHPFGARFFPELLFGGGYGKYWDSVSENHEFWRQITGVPIQLFKTFFGDLYIEFGYYLPIVFTLIFSFVVYIIVNMRKLNICILPLLNYYFEIIIYAFGGLFKRGHSAIYQLEMSIIITCLLVWYMKYYYSKKIKLNK